MTCLISVIEYQKDVQILLRSKLNLIEIPWIHVYEKTVSNLQLCIS
jgi:hypothetical protein